jgi:preprotein translocase subunit SecY
MILAMIAGTVFLVWLGEQITQYGIGNGISIIIFAGIVSGLPEMVGRGFLAGEQGQLMGLLAFIDSRLYRSPPPYSGPVC